MSGMVVKKETIKTGWQEVAGVLLLAGCLLSFFGSAIVFIYVCQQGGLINEVSPE